MKRGLVSRKGDGAAFVARVKRLQERLLATGAAVGLIYEDVYRADDVAYLTNLCVYWNEAILAVPAEGQPTLLTKLSPRVHQWMRATSTLDDLRSGPNFVKLVSDYLAEREPRSLAVVDRAWWPAALLEDVAAAAPEWSVRDLPDGVRSLRLTPDGLDAETLERAAAIAGEAARRAATAVDESANGRIAIAELHAREAGAKDLIADCQALDDGVEAVRVTVQLGNVWSRAARMTGGTGLPATAGPRRALSAAESRLRAGTTRSELERASDGGTAAKIAATHHADLGSNGDFRPGSDLVAPLRPGAVVTLEATVETIAGSVTALADTYLVSDGGSVALSRVEGATR
jgi:hypothetical protein